MGRGGRRGRLGVAAAAFALLWAAGPAPAQSPPAPGAAQPAATKAAPAEGSSSPAISELAGPGPAAKTLAAPAAPAAPSTALRVAPAGDAAQALAQAVLTVDQEALYRQSRWGQRAQMQLAAESRQVAADNERAFAALVADEDALTAARATLSAEEFRSRATAFDERVTTVRAERDAARDALTARAERDRALFYQAVAPVLGRVMAQRGALVVLDQRTVLISDERTDVTAATIAAIDAELGDGSAVTAEAEARAAKPAPAAAAAPAGDPADAPPANPSPAAGEGARP